MVLLWRKDYLDFKIFRVPHFEEVIQSKQWQIFLGKMSTYACLFKFRMQVLFSWRFRIFSRNFDFYFFSG